MIALTETTKYCDCCTTSTINTTGVANCDCIISHQCGCCTIGHIDIEPELIAIDTLSIKHIIPFSGLRKPSLRKPPQPKYLNKHPRIKRSSSKG